MASGRVRFQSLEARKRLECEAFVGLNRPIEGFSGMRLQCLQCGGCVGGAYIISGKIRAGCEELEFVRAPCNDGRIEPLRTQCEFSRRIILFRGFMVDDARFR